MAKPAHFSSVADWTDSLFTVQTSDAKSLNQQTLSFTGKILFDVHPNSPAGMLGLKAGDILYALNGGVFDIEDLNKTFQPRRFGRTHSFDLLRPSTRQKIRVKGPTFPFGASFRQTAESFAAELRGGDPDPADASRFWETGDTAALAGLLPAFEAFNIRLISLNGAPYSGAFPQNLPYNTELPEEDSLWPGALTWHALCAAHAGQWDRAQYVSEAVEDHFNRSRDSGMMNMFAAMAYIRSMLAEQRGQIEIAANHIKRAIEMSPETDVLYRRMSALTKTDVTRPASPFLGVKLSYDLPKHDPAGRFKQAKTRLTLGDCAGRLSPGEYILICIMSSYRTNGPYVEGFQRAHVPLANLKDIFREVHVITSWDKSTSRDLPHWPAMEPKLSKSNVNVSVLFDAESALDEQLPLVSAPTNLIVNHKGLIVAEGWLGDDAILWDAMAPG